MGEARDDEMGEKKEHERNGRGREGERGRKGWRDSGRYTTKTYHYSRGRGKEGHEERKGREGEGEGQTSLRAAETSRAGKVRRYYFA